MNTLIGETGDAAAASTENVATSPATARTLYGDPTILHRQSLSEIEAAGAHALRTPAETKAEAAVVAQILDRHTTNEVDGRLIAGAIAQGIRNPPTAEQAAKWAEESLHHLRDEYGDPQERRQVRGRHGAALRRARCARRDSQERADTG